MGMRLVAKTVNQDDPSVYHLFYASETGKPGSELTFFEYPGAVPGRTGAGMVHRIISRVGSPEALDFWAKRLEDEGVGVGRVGDAGVRSTPIIDRFYFHSLYFREPSGVLFEIADDAPGFTVDGPVAELGSRIILPPFLEDRREEIEARLTPLPDPRGEAVS